MTFTKSIDRLEPENKTPLLLCEGARCLDGDHVPHTFVRRELRRTQGPGVAWFDIFRCDECGHERVYGASEF